MFQTEAMSPLINPEAVQPAFPYLIGFIFFKQFPHSGYDKNIFMGHFGQLRCQDPDFFAHGFVFVHDKEAFAFNFAQTAFGLDAGGAKILFGNGDFQLFSQLLKLLVYLFRFH